MFCSVGAAYLHLACDVIHLGTVSPDQILLILGQCFISTLIQCCILDLFDKSVQAELNFAVVLTNVLKGALHSIKLGGTSK